MKHMEAHLGKNELGKVGESGKKKKSIWLDYIKSKISLGCLFNITYILNELFHIYKNSLCSM